MILFSNQDVMVAKKTQSRGDIEKKERNQASESGFTQKKLSSGQAQSNENKEVPTWIIVVFIFALVFCLFAVYKVFIYGRGYDTQSQIETINLLPEQNPSIITIDSGAVMDENLVSGGNLAENTQTSTENTQSTTGNTPNQPRVVSTQQIDRTADNNLIQDFYQFLVSENLSDMNRLVHAPLKNSTTRDSHWNRKNIGIFTRNLSGDLNLSSIFLIPGSVNEAKNTRQYSYTLDYTISGNQHFTEDWKVTLINLTGDRTQISEIMCTTKGCSRSPFFWPQNYNLK